VEEKEGREREEKRGRKRGREIKGCGKGEGQGRERHGGEEKMEGGREEGRNGVCLAIERERKRREEGCVCVCVKGTGTREREHLDGEGARELHASTVCPLSYKTTIWAEDLIVHFQSV
jgi:hypothetical protein